MRPLVLATLTVLTVGAAAAQPLAVGDPAPPLGIEEYVRPADGPGGEPAGPPLLIEFWATWCAPCVKQLPHLNALADEFAGRVQFVAVTDEGRDDVERFLAEREIRGAVGIDRDRSLFEAFGVYAIPQTVLVGPDGRVAAVTKAEDVDRDVLARLVAGERVSEPAAVRTAEPAETVPATGGPVAGPLPSPPAPGPRVPGQIPETYVVSVRPLPPDTPGSGFSGVMPGFVDIWALPLRDVLGMAYGVSPVRVLGPDSTLAARYQVVVKLPASERGQFDGVFQGALASATGLRPRLARQTVGAYVLRAPDGPGRLRESDPGAGFRSSSAPGISAARANPIRSLTGYLEGVLGAPVVDETGLAGRYDWNLEHGEGPAAVRKAVRDQLGLGLVPADLDLDVLVVEPGE